MRLSINNIISYNNGKIERILWIDEDYIKLFCIDLEDDKAIPIMKNVSDIIDDIRVGIASHIDDDYYINIIDENCISKSALDIRDKAWNIIEELVEDKNQPYIYMKKHRGKLIKSIIEKKKVTKKTVYKHLRRYWRGGQVKNSLIAKYDYCGGIGKNKKLGVKKVGRPRTFIEIEGEGINIDDEIKEIFRKSIKKYYSKDNKTTLTLAYQLMINEYYSEEQILENGKKRTIVKDNIPTYQQFRYWYRKEHDIRTITKSRESDRIYNLKSRALLGNSTKEALYPGGVYQIDATEADINLVAKDDRSKKIGRPTIYLVVDVFSRMITGVYVGLEKESWVGAMTALANCGIDKQKFCKEYGIDISKEEWECRCLPQILISDRGSLISKKADTLIDTLGVDVKNTAAYRADLKGIVERKFRDMHDKIKAFVPGYIDKNFRERGSHDYRLDATLDLYEFTKVIILYIISHNATFMDYYKRDSMMIEDNLPSIPKDIWSWGIKNRGSSRHFSEKVIMLNLMPKDNASITESGIRFKNMNYTCEEAIKEGWFEEARRNGRFHKEISYDPRNMDKIYIRINRGRDFITCNLIDENSIYKNKSIEEINYLIKVQGKLQAENNKKKLEENINRNNSIQDVVKEAKLKSKRFENPYTTKKEQLSNINENRKIEKNLNRKKEAFNLTEEDIESLSQLNLYDENKNSKVIDKPKDAGISKYMSALLKKKGFNK